MTAQASAALVVNGGFETGSLSGWTVSGAPAGAATVTSNASDVHSGSFAASIAGTLSGGFDFQLIEQTITGLLPSTTYTISAYQKGERITLYVNSYGGSQVTTTPPAALAAYQLRTLNFTTGATNTSAKIGFYKDESYAGYTLASFVDSVSVAVIPEPASVALLALGGLLCARRRAR